MAPRESHHTARVDVPRAGDLVKRVLQRLRPLVDNDRAIYGHSRRSSNYLGTSYLGRNREWRAQTRAEFARSVSETAARLHGRSGR